MNESAILVETTNTTREAEEVAKWCNSQHLIEKKIASRQIILVLFTLILGILLVFALPRLIEKFDYLGRTDRLPNNQINNATIKIDEINQHEEIFKSELKKLYGEKAVIGKVLDQTEHEIKVINTKLDSRLSEPLTMFRLINVTNFNSISIEDSNSIGIRTVIESKNGTLIAAGFERKRDLNYSKKFLLLLRSTDSGKTWTAERPKVDGERFQGAFSALLQTEDGTLIATAYEEEEPFLNRVLLLRSTDSGKTWTAERLKVDGVNIKGSLSALLQTEDGTLIAAGFEQNLDLSFSEKFLLLLQSTDSGKTWTAERPKEGGERFQGAFSALLQTEDGTLIAAAYEEMFDFRFNKKFLSLFRSTDSGKTWTADRPKEDGARIKGSLSALLQTEDGTVIAAGTEEGEELLQRNVLLLRSTNSGKTWTADRPKEDGKTILGNVDSIIQTNDGKFIAVGYKFGIKNLFDTLVSFTPEVGKFLELTTSDILLLYSNDGKSWTEVLLSSEKNDELHTSFTNLIQTKEGGIVLTRQGYLPLISLTNTEIDTLRNFSLPPELILDTKINSLLTNLVKSNETIKFQSSILTQTENLVYLTNEIIDRQSKATQTFKELTDLLDKALREAEPVKEAGRIATRIAVLGLLIYLVQILLNRYRYHIRLSKFYQGRSQALRLIIADDPNQSLFKKSSLNDLAITLTPETIGFDNIKETPTVFSSTILNDRK